MPLLMIAFIIYCMSAEWDGMGGAHNIALCPLPFGEKLKGAMLASLVEEP